MWHSDIPENLLDEDYIQRIIDYLKTKFLGNEPLSRIHSGGVTCSEVSPDGHFGNCGNCLLSYWHYEANGMCNGNYMCNDNITFGRKIDELESLMDLSDEAKGMRRIKAELNS